MSLNADDRSQFNLKTARTLLAESGSMATDILVQILSGFGAKDIQKASDFATAQSFLGALPFDLVLVGTLPGEKDEFDLVHWVRWVGPLINKYAPIIMVSGHTAQYRVERARDCGAHFIIAKPLTPIIVLERIFWSVREQRPFVSSAIYIGPERRFKFDGPPDGHSGRRLDDLPAEVGDAEQPNMSQAQIDALMSPKRAAR